MSANKEAQAAYQAAFNEAVLEERVRIVSVLSLPEAEGRFEVARQLALTPGMSSETARAILARVPRADQRVQHQNPFAQAMAALGNPDVSGIEARSDRDLTRPGMNAEDTVAEHIVQTFRKCAGEN